MLSHQSDRLCGISIYLNALLHKMLQYQWALWNKSVLNETWCNDWLTLYDRDGVRQLNGAKWAAIMKCIITDRSDWVWNWNRFSSSAILKCLITNGSNWTWDGGCLQSRRFWVSSIHSPSWDCNKQVLGCDSIYSSQQEEMSSVHWGELKCLSLITIFPILV